MRRKMCAIVMAGILTLSLVGCGKADDKESTASSTTPMTTAENVVNTESTTESQDVADNETIEGTLEENESNIEDENPLNAEFADEIAYIESIYEDANEEILPWGIMTNALDLNDMDMVTYHTGLTDLTGIKGILLSESLMSSTAYSMVYIVTEEGADAAAIQKDLMEHIDVAKWICVSAEAMKSAILDNDIFFVMGAPETVEDVYKCAIENAQGVYTDIVEE